MRFSFVLLLVALAGFATAVDQFNIPAGTLIIPGQNYPKFGAGTECDVSASSFPFYVHCTMNLVLANVDGEEESFNVQFKLNVERDDLEATVQLGLTTPGVPTGLVFSSAWNTAKPLLNTLFGEETVNMIQPNPLVLTMPLRTVQKVSFTQLAQQGICFTDLAGSMGGIGKAIHFALGASGSNACLKVYDLRVYGNNGLTMRPVFSGYFFDKSKIDLKALADALGMPSALATAAGTLTDDVQLFFKDVATIVMTPISVPDEVQKAAPEASKNFVQNGMFKFGSTVPATARSSMNGATSVMPTVHTLFAAALCALFAVIMM